jgi:hypothetical protein
MEGGFADDRRVDHEKLRLTGEVMNNPWSSEVRVEGADAVIDRMYDYFKEISELTVEEKSVDGKSKWSVIINYVKYYNREVIDKELEKLAKNLSNLERDNENARAKFEATKRDLEQKIRESKDEDSRKKIEAALKKEVNQNDRSAMTRKTMSDKITANIAGYEAKKVNIDTHDRHISELSRIYSEFIRGYGDVGKIINPINYHGPATIYRKYVDDGGNTEYFFVVKRGLTDSGAYLIDHLGATVAVTESDVSGVITDGDREINRVVIESSDKYEKCGECKYLHHLYSLEHNFKNVVDKLIYLNYDTIRNNYGSFVEFVEYFFTLLPTQFIYKKSFHLLNVYLYAARLSYSGESEGDI